MSTSPKNQSTGFTLTFCISSNQSNDTAVITYKIVEYSQKAVHFCLTNFLINANAKNCQNTGPAYALYLQ